MSMNVISRILCAVVFSAVPSVCLLGESLLELPPPGSGGAERIRIPIKEAQEAIESGEAGREVEDKNAIAAFSLAAQRKGWIPRDSAGILRPGMQVKVTLMIQGAVEFAPEPQRINQSGKIGLPLLQSVEVGNRDLEEVEAMITEMYSEYYRDPLVNVEHVGNVEDASMNPWGYVTMMGNVANPGPVAVPPTRIFTVSAAVQRAGGVSASAKKGAIRIFRPLPEEDSVELIRVDLDDLGRKGQTAEDVTLLAGDVVYIPERVF